MAVPCVVFALRREAMFFRRAWPRLRRFPSAPCLAELRGDKVRPLMVLETGVGAAAMERALGWALDGCSPGEKPPQARFVLLAGFSGGLRPEVSVGALVLADEVVAEDGQRWATTWPGSLPCVRGRIASAAALVGTSAQKRQWADQQALAVDMESAVVARFCQQRDVPFGCLRAISDGVGADLSPWLLDVVRDGRVAWGRLLGAVMRRPSRVRELWRLGRDSRKAARALGEGLQALLRGAEPWGRNPILPEK